MNPILPFLILRLFNNNNNNDNAITWIQRIQKCIIMVNIGFQIVSIFGEFIFVIDDQNVYHRTTLTYIYAVFLVTSITLMIIALNIFSKRIQSTNFLTLCGLCLMLCTGFILRLILQNTNFDWLCISFSLFIIELYYITLSLRLDPLTQLLNRQVYQTKVEKINYSTLIIMIDANNFKTINDTYGHECGDRTLRLIANCILKAYSEYGWCFRIGGDEFCVILKHDSFKKLIENTQKNDVYVMSENLMKKLDEVIQARASKDNHNCLHYGVSQGYGIYYYPPEYPNIKNNILLKRVLHLADMRMYCKKKQFKNNITETSVSHEVE